MNPPQDNLKKEIEDDWESGNYLSFLMSKPKRYRNELIFYGNLRAKFAKSETLKQVFEEIKYFESEEGGEWTFPKDFKQKLKELEKMEVLK